MNRVAFMLKVEADQIDVYKARHANLWSEMRAALERSGWRNYSLFMRPDGLLFGYWEAEDPAAATAAMYAEPIRAQWQAYMASLFEDLPDQPGTRRSDLEEVFHLD